jgi:cation transport regulator ChaB
MLSFWDTKDSKSKVRYKHPEEKEKKEKKEKDKKDKTKSFSNKPANKPEKKANVTIVEDNKEIGRTTVIKKPQKSGFWVEKPSTDGNDGNDATESASSVALKRENFLTESDSFEDIPKKVDHVEKLKLDIDTLKEYETRQHEEIVIKFAEQREEFLVKFTEQSKEIDELKSKLHEFKNIIRALTLSVAHLQSKDKKKKKRHVSSDIKQSGDVKKDVKENVKEYVPEEIKEVVPKEVKEIVTEEAMPEEVKEVIPEEVEKSIPEEVREVIHEEIIPEEEVKETVTVEVIPEEVREVRKVIHEEVRKVIHEEVKKVIHEEVKEVIPEEVKEVIPEEVRKVIHEEVKEVIPEEVIHEEVIPEEVKETVTEQIEESIPGEVKETVTEQVEEAVTEEVKASIPEEVRETVTEEVNESIPEKVIHEEVKEAVTEEVKASIPEEVRETVTEEVNESIPEKVIHEEAIPKEDIREKQNMEIPKYIKMKRWGEILYPFGRVKEGKYAKGEEATFEVKALGNSYYVYGEFDFDKEGYTVIRIQEITRENGEVANPKNIKFPISLVHLKEHQIREKNFSFGTDSEESAEPFLPPLKSLPPLTNLKLGK